MQIDPEAKMIYVHIPRTGGSWFSYQWPAHHTRAPFLKKNEFGRHSRLPSIPVSYTHLTLPTILLV